MPITVSHSNPTALQRAYLTMVDRTGKEVAVGFPSGQANAYPDGTQVTAVAAYHVYGMGVPKRDFMGLAKDEITQKTAPIITRALRSDNLDVLYEAAGLLAEASIKKAIVDLQDPPNAESTIAAKESSNPLIDTGHLVQSVTYVVRDRTR